MASKYEMISELYRRTGAGASGSPEAWQAFLSSACRNYKCRFDEQMLIYAQRPDATAVLEIEKWNEKFHRYVRRGSKGIAVFAAADNNKTRLKYYFDVSDTEPSYRGGMPVPIWQMSDRYAPAVIESWTTRSPIPRKPPWRTISPTISDSLPTWWKAVIWRRLTRKISGKSTADW